MVAQPVSASAGAADRSRGASRHLQLRREPDQLLVHRHAQRSRGADHAGRRAHDPRRADEPGCVHEHELRFAHRGRAERAVSDAAGLGRLPTHTSSRPTRSPTIRRTDVSRSGTTATARPTRKRRDDRDPEPRQSYLGTTYPAKKFIIQNWEGDSAISALAYYCNEPLTTPRCASRATSSWISARVKIVLDARSAGVANVYSGLEFNAVQRLTSSDDYYGNNCTSADTTSLSPGCSWCDGSHPCVISTVAPKVSVDYLSYSSWPVRIRWPQPTSCFDAGGVRASRARRRPRCTACYGKHRHPAAVPRFCVRWTVDAGARGRAGLRAAGVVRPVRAQASLISGAAPAELHHPGEFGTDRATVGEARAANRMNYVVNGLTGFGASYGIYWQILDSASGGINRRSSRTAR